MNINISTEASEHLDRDAAGRVLRIAFTTGCGGSGYRLSLEDEPRPGDHVIELSGIRLAVDSMAASRLDGATIDYVREEDGYTLDHPDAVMAIWCE
ncbi:MAG TPA: iron-sulfur cluster assembly accessory protein [Thermoanaerobaculia bacterium]|nr:iron-sulfur cluster assembly accessory protein [Thermoanaerobaculia bacterium]